MQQRISYGISKNMVDFQEVLLRVDRKDIFYVNYIVQGYDGLGTVSTKDPLEGILLLKYSAENKTAIFDIIQALKQEGIIKEVNES